MLLSCGLAPTHAQRLKTYGGRTGRTGADQRERLQWVEHMRAAAAPTRDDPTVLPPTVPGQLPLSLRRPDVAPPMPCRPVSEGLTTPGQEGLFESRRDWRPVVELTRKDLPTLTVSAKRLCAPTCVRSSRTSSASGPIHPSCSPPMRARRRSGASATSSSGSDPAGPLAPCGPCRSSACAQGFGRDAVDVEADAARYLASTAAVCRPGREARTAAAYPPGPRQYGDVEMRTRGHRAFRCATTGRRPSDR